LLFLAYVRLARFEERKATTEFGDAYREYIQKTPAFFPPLKQWQAFLTVNVPDAK
jgi:protein-S-isoprenylcysteine O-methyltransferase Ste14